jgi:DNA-binding GntR family transcriptional regulator
VTGSGGPRRPHPEVLDLPSLTPLPTAAERAAELIRTSIFEGKFRPGMPLPETALAQALQVSRNTVREAFRTLMNEHLLAYEVNKGMSVRTLAEPDVRDIYRLRRMLELSAIDLLAEGDGTLDPDALAAVLAEADRAAQAGDWVAVGTANLRFHELLVAVHGSPRISEFFHRLMTEMRLGFLSVPDPAGFHGGFLRRNHDLRDHLVAGRLAEARTGLAAYLDEAAGVVSDAVGTP